MNRVLGGMKWTECFCYMDDILIFGRDFHEHQARLDKVLQVIGDAGLTLQHSQIKKCVFAADRVAHLGHLVEKEGVRPVPTKVEAMVSYQRPKSTTQLRAFLGLAAYYRLFIKGFATEQMLAALQAGSYSPRGALLLQQADEEIRKIVLQLQGYESPLAAGSKQFVLGKGVLYRKNDQRGRHHLLVTPSILRKEVISECYDTPSGGHQGIEKTLARVAERYWWKGLNKSVTAYVKSCPFCQSFEARVGHPAHKLCSIPPAAASVRDSRDRLSGSVQKDEKRDDQSYCMYRLPVTLG